jgi:hypothetical protein
MQRAPGHRRRIAPVLHANAPRIEPSNDGERLHMSGDAADSDSIRTLSQAHRRRYEYAIMNFDYAHARMRASIRRIRTNPT